MSTVTCSTLLSQPAAPSVKISGRPRRLQPGKVAAAPAVALPMVRRRKLSPLSVCHAFTYEVPPFALVHPKYPGFSPPTNNSWKITEDAEHINLWFKVEEATDKQTTTKDDLKVEVKGNLLLIKYNKAKPDDAGTTATPSPAAKLDVRLLMPAGYDNKGMVEAELSFGSLLVTVTKPKQPESADPTVPIKPLE